MSQGSIEVELKLKKIMKSLPEEYIFIAFMENIFRESNFKEEFLQFCFKKT